MAERNNTENSYKESFKATSLFGGVQIFEIIIKIIRSKFIAILLGPTGMGISGLLSSTTDLISAFTNCGLRASAVRNIAEANSTGQPERVAVVITVLRKLVWYTGGFGALVCLLFSSYWSRITFGNTDYIAAFAVLSLSILFMQLTYGQYALLQGLQKYRYLAKSNVFGQIIGLSITVPLYYFWGIDAIVPVLLLSNVTTFILAYYFARKVKIENVKIDSEDLKREGGNMMKMGVLISLQGLLSVLAAYLIRIFIGRSGGDGLDNVGLYTAGFTIVNTYVGMVLTAMGTDYYPRLSKVAGNSAAFKMTINQQTEIALLLLAPIIVAFIIFIKTIILILYSNKFLPIEGLVYWAMSATLFKALAWSLSFSILAKGDIKVFFWNEVTAITYGFGINVGGYYLYGLTGLGISMFVRYIIYFLQLWVITGKRYEFSFDPVILKVVIILSVSLGMALVLRTLTPEMVSYPLGILLLAAVSCYSFFELDKRIALKDMLKNMFGKNRHK